MTKLSWQDHFKNYIENAESLYSKESTTVSFLMFCLRAKMIPIQEYLEWAKENFQVPVLSESFFKIHQPQKEFYKKWQKIYNWSADCMPIAEWDGALIIACLEVPQNYKNMNPTIFVLASHQVLDATWLVYQKSERAAESDFTDMTALAATVVAPSPRGAAIPSATESDELILQDEVSSEEGESSEEKSSEESEDHDKIEGLDLSAGIDEEAAASPEGLMMDAAPVNLSGLGKVNLEQTATEKISFEQPSLDKPVMEAAEIETPAPAESAEIEVALKKGPRKSEPLMNFNIEVLSEKTKIDAMVAVDGDEEEMLVPPMPEKKPALPSMPVANNSLPSAPVKPILTGNANGVYLLEKLRKVGQAQFDKEAQASFQRLKTFFKKSMLLAIGDKDSLVKPLLWDHGFDSADGGAPEFNLKTPSIFKIVSGTQKPYHGFVTVNDLNESFFESWNHGQIPDHVTIVPLLDGDHVVGMLMGLGEKANYNKAVLSFTENVAKDLSLKILKSPIAKSA